MNKANLNCIIVGHNEHNFNSYAEISKKMQNFSGAYREVKHNSVLFEGKRLTYMDLLNKYYPKTNEKNTELTAFEVPQYVCYYLANILLKNGLSTEIISPFQNNKNKFEQLLKKEPAFVAITTTFYFDTLAIKEIIDFVRQKSQNTKIIVGGPFVYNTVTSNDEETFKMLLGTMGADYYIVDSQGEKSFLNLVANNNNKAGLKSLKNLIYWDEETKDYIVTERTPESNSLCENTVDWSLFNKEKIKPLIVTRTSRGCPFSCSYCTYPFFAGKFTKQSLDSLKAELENINKAGIKQVVFIDDTFNISLERLKEICKFIIKKQFTFKWYCYYRTSLIDDEIVELMAKSNCVAVCIGAESGDDNILENMNKKTTAQKTINAIKKFKKAGIITYAGFVMGFPGETQQSIQKTYELINEAKPDYYNIHLWYNSIAAPINKRAQEFGLSGTAYSWKHNTMNYKQAADAIDLLYKKIKNSNILPLSGFSFQTIPYLFSKGISMSQFSRFVEIAQEMLINSLDDMPNEYHQEKKELENLFCKVEV